MTGKPTHLVEYENMLMGRHVHMRPRGRREGAHLDRSAYILLSRVRLEGPMSLRELSDAFGLDVSTLNRQTAGMLRSGLVERIPDSGGGIARKFQITAEGERLLELERKELIRGLDDVFETWPAEDVAAFAGYLKRFNADIERLSGRPWPRPEGTEGPEGPGES